MHKPQKPSSVITAIALLSAGALTYAGLFPIGPLPALGDFVDPMRGIAASAKFAEHADSAQSSIAALSAEVRVVYDDRGVPHIFATNVNDAHLALGYVVARDRLFQIDVQSRAAAGTLTGLVGKRGWVVDRRSHQLGMPLAAERRMSAYDTTSAAWQRIKAYAAGVNAFVNELTPASYPIEYKLLGAKPKQWQPIDMFHLLNRMGQTLAYSSNEFAYLEAASMVGKDAANALFPIHSPIVEPIQPNGSNSERIDSLFIPPPAEPDSSVNALLQIATPLRAQSLRAQSLLALLNKDDEPGDDAIGSNNWAVAPARSLNNHAILAGDPHLELTLPSIWYEAHIVVPDTLDVYGVTIPGAPGIVIGFNKSVSWTFTNTGADVADYYVERVDSIESPTKYMVDGEYRALEKHHYVARDARGKTTGDSITVYWTHRGPMRWISGKWVSMRWTVLEAERDFEAFNVAARASSARELLDSMAVYYTAPAQNMLVADIGGNIAIRSTGKFPIRPDSGRGDRLFDGSRSDNDWRGYWEVAEYPQSFNPAQGFIASANQEPLDMRDQQRYMGADWERPWRAMRINKLLRSNSTVSADQMRLYQSDPGSARADWFVPAFINAANAAPATQKLTKAAQLLAEWDRLYNPENARTLLFEEAMSELQRRLWDELYKDSTTSAPLPTDAITAILLRDKESVWWDDKRTAHVETRDELLAQVLERALDRSIERAGEVDSVRWQWKNFRVANIDHLLGISSFSRRGVAVQGGPATLWPSSGNGRHGPSWRMVVEMQPTPLGWGTYPGGQSGNPLSSRYDNRISQWSAGELDTLLVPSSSTSIPQARVSNLLTLTPTGAK